ncbi:MAG: prolyl aminopeptidase [Betaproteobacteria bacterium]|jgi:proline iminopeptidase
MTDIIPGATGRLYPPIEPYHSGSLEVSEGHRVYYEQSGHPSGMPVLFLHGGPGSATKPDHRRYFDPAFYRIVLFDQRGCGRSTPLGERSGNTTAHLVDDIEQLRRAAGIGRWLLFGGSWGSTLALAYAQAHPDRVRRLILRGIFTASRRELDWYFVGLRQFIPEAWEALHEVAPGAHWPVLVARYHELLNHAESAVALAAATRWNAYESAIMNIGEGPAAAGQADAAALARARVQVHYLVHGCFLADGQLLANVARIAHLPVTILHGRRDFVCPPVMAFELARHWPGADLRFVEAAGHASSHPALERELVVAADAARHALTDVGESP